jgi:hypothetical protein
MAQSSGSQATGPQVSGSGTPESTSKSQSSRDGVEQGESPPRDTTSRGGSPSGFMIL